jgi:serine/threonine protein kinase
VRATGGADAPEDWAGALELLLKLPWHPKSMRWVCWIADAPAHGVEFGGSAKHNDQCDRFKKAIAEFGETGPIFTSFSLDDSALCTFQRMQSLWPKALQSSFEINLFNAHKDSTKSLADALSSIAKDSILASLLRSVSTPGASRSILPDCLKSTYTMMRVIGKGAYGTVFSAIHYSRGPVAIKSIQLDPPNYDTGEDGVKTKASRRERMVLRILKHPGCLNIIEQKIVDDKVFIVTDLMRGDLQRAIEDEGNDEPWTNWSATSKSICAIGIAFALEYIHGNHFIHRDLKMANILVNRDLEPVIGDFGLTRKWGLGAPDDVRDLTMVVGTPLHMAPETYAFGGNCYDLSVDIFAYSVILYFFWADSNCYRFDDKPSPVRNGLEHQNRMALGARFVRVDGIPDTYWELMTRGWSHLPHTRPSAKEIVDDMITNPDAWLIPGSDRSAVVAYIEKMRKYRPE